MLGAIKYNLSNLTSFSGRDARQTFWFYVLFLVIVQYALGMLISMPMMGGAMKDAFNGVQKGLSQAEMQAHMMQSMGSYMRTSMVLSSIVSLANAFLLLAAFARRLHDSNRPSWIAVVALVLSLAAQAFVWSRIDEVLDAVMRGTAGDLHGAFEIQSKMLPGSLMSWASMLIVIVFGAWPSTSGPNHYGETPVRF